MARKQLGSNPSNNNDAVTKAHLESGSATLTNKTIDATSNVLTNIPVENIVSANNLMDGYNPSFDSDISGWTVASGTWSYDGSTGRTANGSARFTASGVQGEIASPTIPVTEGITYLLEIWISGSGITNVDGDIDLWVETYNGGSLDGQWWCRGWQDGWGSEYNLSGTFGWRRLYGQWKPGTGIDGIRLVVNIDSDLTAGDIFIDDARVAVAAITPDMVGGLGHSIDDLWNGSGTIANKSFDNTNDITILDTNLTFQDNNDTAKTMSFNLANITSGNHVTLNVPSVNGSNTLITLNSTATMQNKRIVPRITTVVSSATPTFNTDTCDMLTITALATNITSMSASGDSPSGAMTGTPNDAQKLMVRIKDDGTSRTITWGPKFQSSGAATLLSSTISGKEHNVFFIYSATVSKWVCMAVDATGY